MTGGASLFDRPGMGGSIAFRNTLFSFEKEGLEGSIGSAGSLVNEDDEDEVQIELPPFNEADFAPVAIFLTGLGKKIQNMEKIKPFSNLILFFRYGRLGINVQKRRNRHSRINPFTRGRPQKYGPSSRSTEKSHYSYRRPTQGYERGRYDRR